MAAGAGTRLQPYTLDTPKSLLKVNGKPVIESLIETLKAKHIDDITIITGYLREHFSYLKYKYMVNIVYNPWWVHTNNISSLYVARKYLSCTLIMDADQIIYDPSVIPTDIEHSGYLCYYTDKRIAEWGLTLNDENKIIYAKREFAEKNFALQSVSAWTKEDTSMLKRYLQKVFIRKYSDRYWDDIAMFIHPENFALYGYPIEKNAIVEFDTVEEYERILQNEKT